MFFSEVITNVPSLLEKVTLTNKFKLFVNFSFLHMATSFQSLLKYILFVTRD